MNKLTIAGQILGSVSSEKKRRASIKNGHAPKTKTVEQHATSTEGADEAPRIQGKFLLDPATKNATPERRREILESRVAKSRNERAWKRTENEKMGFREKKAKGRI